LRFFLLGQKVVAKGPRQPVWCGPFLEETGLQIALIHGHMFHAKTWQQVVCRLEADGIDLMLLHQFKPDEALKALEEKKPQVVLADLYRDFPGYDQLIEQALKAPIRLALGDQLPAGFGTLPVEKAHRASAYLAEPSGENYYQGIRYLAYLAGMPLEYDPPGPVRTHGIYHPLPPELFNSVNSYLGVIKTERNLIPDRNVVGMLCYYGQILESNCDEIRHLILSLEKYGFLPLCIYCEGMNDSTLPMERRYPWLIHLQKIKPHLVGLVNLMAGRFLSNSDDLHLLSSLDVPVFQGVRLHRQTQEQWRANPQGVPSTSLVYSFAHPETSGVIEPTLVATEELGSTGEFHFEPVPGRIEHLSKRIAAWASLRNLPNEKKKLALLLHNNPCRGVEATAGQAVGLDAAQSAVEIMKTLSRAGYAIDNIPVDGSRLMDLIHEHKALSEFRWTTVDQIVSKGGALHLMSRDDYMPWFQELPQKAREKVFEDWGEFPGQGMVWDEDGPSPRLVISGLRFGNLTLLIQPKRGCYGAKCTGEVCRILHNPAISPPHHWLATYKYLQDNCHAVIHLGTEGALEYLPGKRAALSGACFPEISLGVLPNIYVYVMDAPGEGLMAKRRGRAVIVDHLVPPGRLAPDSEASQKLMDFLAQYQRAKDMGETERQNELINDLRPLLESLKFTSSNAGEEEINHALDTAMRQLASRQGSLMANGLHVLGQAPKGKRRNYLLANMLQKAPDGLPNLHGLLPSQEPRSWAFNHLCNRLGRLADGTDDEALANWLRTQSAKLSQSSQEIDRVLSALEGRYIMPGLGGSLALGQHDALPTGRNFFAQDVTRLPSEAAFEVGKSLADQMLNKFLAEEGRFPTSVGISLWSSDAYKSDGEVCAQIMHLLGVGPRRNSQGKVSGVEAVPLDQLLLKTAQGIIRRPRVDVVVQTSGILRDMVPHFVELIDQSARLVAELDEPETWNAPKRNNQKRLAELQASLADEDQPALRRMIASRVFSSQPGSYGLGVGLAIEASAWEDQDDLAETYVNWGGWAYGGSQSGQQAQHVFASHLKGIEISYMKQASPEYELLDCGGYADFQGGMACAAAVVSGKQPKLYWGSSNQNGGPQVFELRDELERSVRTRLLSQAWLDSFKEHGAQGAMEVINKALTVYRWSAVSGQVEQWAFEALTEHLIMDRNNRQWLQKANPYAAEELVRRLLEAESRGIWQAGAGHMQALTDAALELEGDIEETMDDVKADFQGSQVEVLTSKNVEQWRPQWRINPGK
jgi:cobaltochelatase CobN